MKPPRFTCRTLMIVVALAALTSWGYTIWRRSAEFAAKAGEHQFYKSMWEINIERTDYEEIGPFESRKKTSLTDDEKADRAFFEGHRQYEDHLYHKYRRAARFPWLPVSPDPPPPPGG